MSMIDDIIGKKLPTGHKFQAKLGVGNVAKKLYAATRTGALKNLQDNQDVINEIAQNRQKLIRSGKYTKGQRKADYRKALGNKNLNADDKKDLKAILEHWGRGEIKAKEIEVKKAAPSVRETRAVAKRAELHATPDTELPAFLQKNRGSISISGSSTSHQPQRPGSGGGINAGLGGATSASANNAGSTFKAPPRLLK